MKGKQILIGIAVVALIAVGYIAFNGSEYDDSIVGGTMGSADTVIAGVEAAERYRSEQINPDDVQLGDTEIQRLLQSEIIQELISNPTFARAIQEPAVRAAMEEGWTDAMFATEETQQALADIPTEDATFDTPIDDARHDTPIGDARSDTPIEDARRDIPIEDGRSDVPMEDFFNEDHIRQALMDDNIRLAVLDQYVKELMGQEWFKAGLDDSDVQDWIKEAAEREDEGLEEFKPEDAGDTEEFKTDNGEGGLEEFAIDQDEFEDFKTENEDLEEFRTALESNPELKRAIFEHAAIFQRAAEDNEFRGDLEKAVADFQKVEAMFGKAVIENGTLARAIAEDPEVFLKAAQLAKIPEFGKMDEGMRRAILTNKSVQEAVFARTTEFEKTEGGF